MICDHLTLVTIQVLVEVFDCPNKCKRLQFSDTIVNFTRLKGMARKAIGLALPSFWIWDNTARPRPAPEASVSSLKLTEKSG